MESFNILSHCHEQKKTMEENKENKVDWSSTSPNGSKHLCSAQFDFKIQTLMPFL